MSLVFYLMATLGIVTSAFFLITYFDTRTQKRRIRSLAAEAEKRRLRIIQQEITDNPGATKVV